MNKPYVICHMVASIDGRIATSGWNLSPEGRAEYERTAATYQADAWMCGRITMSGYARGTAPTTPISSSGLVATTDFLAPHTRAPYAIAIDPSGKLYWHTNAIDGDHVVAVLTEQVAAAYLAYLQAQQVSYLFAGTQSIDFPTALAKIADTLRVKTLLLEGGGKINGSMLRAGLIDEISLLIAPIADGTNGTPTLFDTVAQTVGPHSSVRLTLLAMEQRADGIVWLRYRCS
ncbi:MAG: RibD family protein [Deltaproteobacteria bacterium]|nr:RibD family protein [Deltaproteobacteria bacterium]